MALVELWPVKPITRLLIGLRGASILCFASSVKRQGPFLLEPEENEAKPKVARARQLPGGSELKLAKVLYSWVVLIVRDFVFFFDFPLWLWAARARAHVCVRRRELNGSYGS